MAIRPTLYNRAIIEPTIVVTGSIGKSDIVHMLMAAIAYGAIPPETRIIEASGNELPRADILIDTDESETNAVCQVEDVTLMADCSCFLAVIGDHRAMVKVGMPGAHAIKHAMIVMQAVDAFAGDLAKVAMALANIAPRRGYGQVKTIGSAGLTCRLLDYSEHASMAALEGALNHMAMLESEKFARNILLLPRLSFSSPEWLATLLQQGDVDKLLTLDRALADIANSVGIDVEYFDRIPFLELRLERLLNVGDNLLAMGNAGDGMSDLLDRIMKRDDMVQNMQLPMAAE